MIRSTFPRRLVAVLILGAVAPGSAPAATFDHGELDGVLSRAVSNGRVDYARIGRDPAFASYLRRIASARIDRLTTDERLAFWINAYNACVIKGVLDNPGIRRPLDVKGFFDAVSYTVAGERVTLDRIENGIIRPGFGEKLIHFGLVCAAHSCPPLLPRAYTGATVRTELARNARAFLASPQNRLDRSRGALLLSKIFDWYKDDFGGERGVRAFVAAYGTAEMRAALARDRDMPIGYLEYDWTLNSR